jgi:hypothetical protein
MNSEQKQEPPADLRFAADLRRQFEDLTRNAPPARRSGFRRAAASARRHRWVVAGAVAAGVVLGLVLIGVPGGSRLSGPQPVSAGEVLARALQALSAGQTLQADCAGKGQIAVSPDGSPLYAEEHSRIYLRADGSVRETLTDKPQTSIPPPERTRDDARDTAYDAAHGVYRDYFRGWDVDAGKYVDRMVVTTGYPLGQPDFGGTDMSATARALQADARATLDTTTYEGRPAWVITGTVKGRPDWAGPGPADDDEIYTITLDQKTCLPVRVQIVVGGVLVMENSWSNVRVDEPLPDDVFRFGPPQGADLVHRDYGFRRLSLAHIGSSAPYRLLLPSWLPDGYVQRWTAFARRWSSGEGTSLGRDVVALQYTRGFDALTVTTRLPDDPEAAATIDPIDEAAWAELMSRDVKLGAGAFGGVTARVVVGPRISAPHLYAVKDGMLLIVAGSASADELIRIAESLETYRPD